MPNVNYMVGGMLSGLGQGIAEDGKAKREEALRRLEMDFRAGESEKDRGFRSGEAALDRGFRSGESELDRGFRGAESEKDRGFRSGERIGGETFQSGEKALDRTATASENDKRLKAETDRANADRKSREQEGAAGRDANRGLLSQYHVDDDGFVTKPGPGGTLEPVLDENFKQKQVAKKKTPEMVEKVFNAETGQDELVPRSQAAGRQAASSKDERAAAAQADDDLKAKASMQATQEARKKGGAEGPWDDGDFPGDGSRGKFIERRTREIYAEQKGKKPAQQSASPAQGFGDEPAKPQAQKPQQAAAKGNVARPTTQAEFDAIPSGGLYINPKDGKQYIKK